jgi:hypothetical protein
MSDGERERQEKRQQRRWWRLTWMLLGGVAVVWGACCVIVYWLGGNPAGEHATPFANTGSFGDSFGVLNTLFSGFAFSGVILSLWMQRNELQLQRKELRLQRNELQVSRGVAESQAQELAAQKEAMRIQCRIAALSALMQGDIQVSCEMQRHLDAQKDTFGQLKTNVSKGNISNIQKSARQIAEELRKLADNPWSGQ